LFEGDRDISGESVAETNEKIENILGRNYRAFCNSTVFGQGAVKRFSQATDGERRKILEQFIRLEIYDRAREFVVQDLAENKKKDDELSREVYRVQGQVEQERETLSGIRSRMRELREKLETFSDFGEKEDSGELAKLQERKRHIEYALRKLRSDRAQVGDSLMDDKVLVRKRSELEKAKSERGKARHTLEALERNLVEIEKRRTRFRQGDVCPECIREFASEKELEEYREKLRKDYFRYEAEAVDLRKRIEELEKEIEALGTEISVEENKRNRLGALDREEAKLASESALIEERIAFLRNASIRSEEQVTSLKRELEELERWEKESKTKLVRYANREKLYEGKRQKLSEERVALEFLSFAFSSKGVKEFCYLKGLDYVNDRLQYYCDRIGDLRVQLTAGPEGIRVRAEFPGRASSVMTSSGGQARRIDLCTVLAFQDLVELGTGKLNYGVFDEFDACLDPDGIERFVTLLQESAATRGTVFVISHNPRTEEFFERIWKVKWENGQSYLEMT